jgi:hypothetical protein
VSTTYTTAQIMMTLAQLAATSPNERPSGESVEQQEARIFNGINSQLSNTNLATGGEWQAVWVGLTQDRGNLAYIARNISQNAFAVCLRGTQFNSLLDLIEDINVGASVLFTATPASTQPILVSQGSMEAFTEITSAIYSSNNTNLLQALTSLLGSAPSQPTLYITGHSLGGAMATMVALYLAAQSWSNTPSFAVYTFAAPTAGLQAFADLYDSTFPANSFRYYNVWDIVPNAWVIWSQNAGLSYVQDNFYPSPAASSPQPGPGPAQSLGLNQLIGQFMNIPGSNVYVQTNQSSNAIALNSTPDYGTLGSTTYDPDFISPSMGDFFGQIDFQHNSYLTFLNSSDTSGPQAPVPPSLVPVVAAVSSSSITPVTPNNGPATGGTAVTITGANFTSDCVVDFGTISATSVTFVSATQITAVSPAGVGTVDIRVTNNFGTSAATPADQFTAPSPLLTPILTAISPVCGPAEGNYYVTLTGTGFISGSEVFFGSIQADASQVVIVSLTEILVTPPSTGSGTVDVTVTAPGLGTSQQTVTFAYGNPVVTSVNPDYGIYGTNSNGVVTINGFGFGATQGNGMVQFLAPPSSESLSAPSEAPEAAASKTATIQTWSDTQITAIPPYYGVMGGAVSQTVDVVVTNNAGLASDTIPSDQYSYYNPKLIYS